MQLWSPVSPTISRVSWQVEDPGEVIVSYEFKYKDLRSQRANSVALVWRPSGLKPWNLETAHWFKSKGEKNYDSPVKQEEFSLTLERVKLLLLVKPSTDWMRATPIRWVNLLFSVCWFKCWSHPKHPPRNNQNHVWQSIKAPRGLVKLKHKINHHNLLSEGNLLRIAWAVTC